MSATRFIRIHDRIRNNNLRRARTFRRRVNPLEIYADNELCQRFRFTSDGIAYILAQLGNTLLSRTFRSEPIMPIIKLLVTIRFLATGAFQVLLGDDLGISQPSVCRCVWEVISLLCSIAPRFIRYPTTQEELNRNKTKFFAIAGFPGVTGLIDCTHVRIIRPRRNEDAFICRKGYPSVNIQATVDYAYRYTSVYAKHAGGKHDSSILEASALWDAHENGEVGGLLLGDSGYPCKSWLLPPYKDPAPGSPEERFNK